jgi:glycosyltransferase involved in cell wall biosynthesis/GT2 family glycosyltransferase
VTARQGFHYVDTGANLGFAGGVNTGLRLITPGTDVLLLNPDAVLAEADVPALHQTLYAEGAERLAATSPTLVDTSGHSQRVSWPLPSPSRMWREAIGVARLIPPPDEYCIGAVLLLRAEALADVGLFDERFFLYAEEADWQRRALDRGWRTAVQPNIRATHVGAGTSSDPSYRESLFHAGIETYQRKWYGRRGWTSYRLAALLGATARGLVLPGRAGARARARAVLYRRGPRRSVENIGPRTSTAVRITHVVVTNAFAGVERYVSEVAHEQAARGADVTVIGGDPVQMRAVLGRARHRSASTLGSALRQLSSLPRQDIIHAHMTAAEAVALASRFTHGAPVVSTRHIARRRGSTPAARWVGTAVHRGLALQLSTSNYVAGQIDEPSTVLWNGVRSVNADPAERDRTVLLLQRLEPEKATAVAVHAWGLSGLAAQGWTMLIAGSGSEAGDLQSLARDLGVQDSVRFLGHVKDTRRLLERAGVLLATGTADAFGLSVAEAMALGTPVIASDGGAHPELLGPDGWTFSVGDPRAAATVLRHVVGLSPAAREQQGAALRRRQQALFDLGGHVDRLAELYSDANRT